MALHFNNFVGEMKDEDCGVKNDILFSSYQNHFRWFHNVTIIFAVSRPFLAFPSTFSFRERVSREKMFVRLNEVVAYTFLKHGVQWVLGEDL